MRSRRRHAGDTTLDDNEPGYFLPHPSGKKYIYVNGNNSPERQRFTVCHELAHIILGLPSDHQQVPSWNYAKKSENEMFCDIFAAELLLPYGLFKPLAEKLPMSLSSVDELAAKFVTSTMATGSRFAVVRKAPCAFVLSEKGKVRYASRSTGLRDAGAWIPPRFEVPQGSISAKLRAGTPCDGREEIEADEWFQHWERGGTLLEEARHLERWDQTLTLLWFEDEEVPAENRRVWENSSQSQEDAELLPELDGVLRFHSKKKRR